MNQVSVENVRSELPKVESLISTLIVGYRTTLMPQKMNNNVTMNIKQSLRTLEGKCTHLWVCDDNTDIDKLTCYVHRILNIQDISHGLIRIENRFGAADYDVKFSAEVLLPKNNTNIVVRVDKIDQASVACLNGPIRAIIPINRIDPTRFTLTKDEMYDSVSNRSIVEGDMIVINVLANRFYPNDNIIRVIGDISDIIPSNHEHEYEKYIVNALANSDILDDILPTDEIEYDDGADEENEF